jgi:hypothetical protein
LNDSHAKLHVPAPAFSCCCAAARSFGSSDEDFEALFSDDGEDNGAISEGKDEGNGMLGAAAAKVSAVQCSAATVVTWHLPPVIASVTHMCCYCCLAGFTPALADCISVLLPLLLQVQGASGCQMVQEVANGCPSLQEEDDSTSEEPWDGVVSVPSAFSAVLPAA